MNAFYKIIGITVLLSLYLLSTLGTEMYGNEFSDKLAVEHTSNQSSYYTSSNETTNSKAQKTEVVRV
ncbi:hypothetical protein ACE939_00575 [Aquimarina sp. W85]|uniref:hypothetical protein n=1 Tax=Aquimarina rhodophyticola TaxID=3342246 RepID=UPI00366B4094